MFQGLAELRSGCAWALRCAVLCCAACVASAHGQDLDQRLLADAADGRLDDFSFPAACLIASGVNDEHELMGFELQFLDMEQRVLRDVPKQSPRERLAALQAGLKRNVLVGAYDREASDLRLAIAEGNYNCLSSAALMYALACASDLPVEIRLERGHVNLQYAEPGQSPVVIEPESAGAARTEAATTPCRLLTRVELLGKFYYNRGVQRLTRHEFAEGLELVAYSLRLDGRDHNARENFVAGLNNWAAAHCAAGEYRRAAALIDVGLRLAPEFAPLLANEQLVRAKLARP